MQLQLRIPEGAKRLLAHCYNIWQFALSRGLAEFNIIANIDKKTILLPKSDRHYAKITDRVVLGELMRAIDSYPNSIIIKCALAICGNHSSKSKQSCLAQMGVYRL